MLSLPCLVAELVPHRAPMLLVEQLLERDRGKDTVLVEAVIPAKGSLFACGPDLLPEYLVELLAQTMAAGNGWDAMQDGRQSNRGYLVGVEDYSWVAAPVAGETVRIAMYKTFEFGAVTIMHGRIEGRAGLLAQGQVKVWEEKE